MHIVERMGLHSRPRAGDIYICEFPACLAAPEMVKTRPVIVVSALLSGRHDLVCVVPISRSPPYSRCDHTCLIPVRMLPRFMQASGDDRWAKCDMLYTFSTRRLSPFEYGHADSRGKRVFEYPRLDQATLRAVRRAIAAGVGIDTTLWNDRAREHASTAAIQE